MVMCGEATGIDRVALRRAAWPDAAMPSAFDLRSAAAADLGFCWPIYRDAMKPLAETGLEWNEPAQHKIVEQAVADAGTSILRQQGADVGWVQVGETGHVVQLKQLFVLPEVRNRGLGTSFIEWMKERADRKRKDLTLEVMSNNPARRLYERLGFKAVTTSGGKITMRY
ncbi:MAG: GNAT family N-acetyltransferase [Alphaproteobacteria bacterium]|nr:GNAT family N-acetyltransferase [Alphaproteobacteria bacterium]